MLGSIEPLSDTSVVITLDATADREELVQRALILQQQLSKQLLKLSTAKEQHRLQAKENITLKEYVTVLLKSTNRLGTDRKGAPLPTLRSSSNCY